MKFQAALLSVFLLSTGIAVAADPSVNGPSPMPTGVYDWSGLYLGAAGGASFGSVKGVFPGTGNNYSHHMQGGIVGVRAGYLQQWDHLIAGVEAGASVMGAKGSATCPNDTYTCSENASALVEVVAKLGWASDHAMIYGKVGWGQEWIKSTASPSFAGYDNSQKNGGLLLGVGAEYALDKNWRLGIDYTRIHLGSQTYSAGGGDTVERSINGDDNLVRASLSYKF